MISGYREKLARFHHPLTTRQVTENKKKQTGASPLFLYIYKSAAGEGKRSASGRRRTPVGKAAPQRGDVGSCAVHMSMRRAVLSIRQCQQGGGSGRYSCARSAHRRARKKIFGIIVFPQTKNAMPVVEHPVHHSVQRDADYRYGCFNRAPFKKTVAVEDWQGVYRWPFRMSMECRYDRSLSDSGCQGCKHAGSGERYVREQESVIHHNKPRKTGS